MTQFRPRLTRPRALLAVAALLVVGLPLSFARAAPCPNVVTLSDPRWSGLKAPAFPSGAQAITAYAVAPFNPDRLFITNGVAVMVTGTGGCAWDPVLELNQAGTGDVALSSVTSVITGIVIPSNGAAADAVLLTVREVDASGISHPHIVVSSTGAAGSWELGDAGLPVAGQPTRAVFAPSRAMTVYLGLSGVPNPASVPTGAPASGGALYRSQDGGRNWTAMSAPADLATGAQITDVTVDPIAPGNVWVIAGGVLYKSVDGGASLVDTNLLERDAKYSFTRVDVFHAAGSLARVAAFSRTSVRNIPVMLWSANNGGAWEQRNAPSAAVESIAHGHRADYLVAGTENAASGGATIEQFDTKRLQWRAITPLNAQTAWDVQIDRTSFLPFGHTSNMVVRWIGATPSSIPPPPKVDRRGLGVTKVDPASLAPRIADVNVESGKTKVVDYTLDLPRRPTPLDLLFVLDDSASMTNLINGVRTNLAKLVRDLRGSGIDVWVGFAYYTTVDGGTSTKEDCPSNKPPIYDRPIDISNPSESLFSAMNVLRPGCTTGNQEPVLIALDQAATGRGMERLDFVPLSTCDVSPALPTCNIPPNLQGNFRSNSLRVVLHSTNEPWISPGQKIEGSPSFSAVAAELRQRRMLQVGIAAGEEAAPDLRQMAKATNAIAPPGGVRCGSDEVLRAGDPLVCTDSGNFSKTMVELLNAIRDDQPVKLYSRGKVPVLQALQPAAFSAVNVKAANKLRFKAVFSCANVAPGTYDVKLGATLRNETLAEATALVTCGALAVTPALPAPVLPPQPQVQPATVPAPPPAPVPQFQAQPQPNPQTGMAQEKQEQVQLATALNDWDSEDAREELAMVRYTDRQNPVTMPMWAAAGMVAAAGGLALGRRRSRVNPARAE